MRTALEYALAANCQSFDNREKPRLGAGFELVAGLDLNQRSRRGGIMTATISLDQSIVQSRGRPFAA